MLLGLVVFALAAWPAQSAPASTYTVCASGCDHTTIQAAINAASGGDLISVTAAVHTEAGIIVKKNLRSRPGSSGTTGGPSAPNTANYQVFTVSSGVRPPSERGHPPR
jgi:pectin methylesterase-like acyl-CoA thioesterase